MSRTEVQQAVGEAELEARAAELRAQIAAPKPETPEQELARVERQIAEQRDAQGKAAAQERITNILRIAGSKRAQMDDETTRIKEKGEYHRITVLNATWVGYRDLEIELAALCNRFGLPVPELPPVLPPFLRNITLPVLADHISRRPEVEYDEDGLRERRSYTECVGSPGYKIIQAAGLVPWPELTAGQRQALVARQQARERAAKVSLPAGSI